MNALRGPVLGIDPSLHRTGWALMDESGILLDSGSVRASANLLTAQRIESICTQMVHAIQKLERKPAYLMIEQQVVSTLPGREEPGGRRGPPIQNVDTALVLAQLQGALTFAVMASSATPIEVLCYPATQWRALLGVTKAKDSKPAGLAIVDRALTEAGVDPQELPEDEREAVGLCMAGRKEIEEDYPLSRKKIEGLLNKRRLRADRKLRKSCRYCRKPVVQLGRDAHGVCVERAAAAAQGRLIA